MVNVDEKLTRNTAELARLALTAEEVTTFTGQLKQILGYIEQLQEVDLLVDGAEIEPLVTPVALVTPMREDVAHPFERDVDGKPKILRGAPDVMYDGFKVPQIV